MSYSLASFPNDSLMREYPRELNVMQQLFREEGESQQRNTAGSCNYNQGVEGRPTNKNNSSLVNQSQNTLSDSFQVELRQRSSDNVTISDQFQNESSKRSTIQENAGSFLRSDSSQIIENFPNYRIKTSEKPPTTNDYVLPNYDAKEILQMKDMHALLLHRECQTLANKVLELEDLLAKAEKGQRKLVKDGCTWTEPCVEEYTSYHCTSCNCRNQDDICKCSVS